MRQQFISSAEAFPAELRDLISSGPVIISGQPLQQYSESGKDKFFQECEYVIELPCFVQTAIMKTLSPVGHSHIDNDYIGTYPILIANVVNSNDEVVFGVKPELNFEINKFSFDR